MAVQASQNNNSQPFILYANPGVGKVDATIQQDAGRAAILAKYTLMGYTASAVPTTGTAGTNTGNGTCTAVAKLGGESPAMVGAYLLTCKTAVANGGVWELKAPNGAILANGLTMTVGAGLATIFNTGGLTFTITDGGTDFAANDTFTITATVVGKYNPANGAALNGQQRIAGIYMGDTILAATLVAGDVVNVPILTGQAIVDKNQIVFENSLALTTVLPSGYTVEQELALLGLITEDTIGISGFEN